MFKGACRLDDLAHRTIIFHLLLPVKKFRFSIHNFALIWYALVRHERLNRLEIRPTGLEPVTPRSEVWCSIQLSYGRFLN